MIYIDESQLPKSVSTGVRVIECLQRTLQSGQLNDIIYRLWSLIFKYAYSNEMSFSNDKGWAAAVEYVASRESDRTSQKAIAEKYRVSSATVSYYTKKIKTILEQS